MDLFPSVADNFNALAENIAIAVAANTTVVFQGIDNTTWVQL